ncbi:hypothetical protein K2173_000689 [Erythroxylum novogranatense]|uniref:CCT domain-containing protein n=1 Tax=Erythroxylum novogranatense TaxID=1862640 RepID=A0AAV8SIR4_9ROSI|nr:hypothetical protein K2173_000689 [Erythroxylum novogranatense]
MASTPYFYDYHFTHDEFSEVMSTMGHESYGSSFSSTFPGGISSRGSSTFGSENLQLMFDNVDQLDVAPTESETSSPIPVAAYPERLGISDTFLDYQRGWNTGISKVENIGCGFQLSDVYDYGDECCGFIPNLKPLVSVCPTTQENWGLRCNEMTGIGHNSFKIGQYTVEERKDRILRYLKKRNQRNFNKTIKYACRKTLADRRVRVRGRFARNNELREEETEEKKNESSQQEKQSYCSDLIVVFASNSSSDWTYQLDEYAIKKKNTRNNRY